MVSCLLSVVIRQGVEHGTSLLTVGLVSAAWSFFASGSSTAFGSFGTHSPCGCCPSTLTIVKPG